jgi:hypothetical protein
MRIIKYWKSTRNYLLKFLNVAYDFIDIIFNANRIIQDLKNVSTQSILLVTDKYIPRIDKVAYSIKLSGEYQQVLISKKRNLPFSDFYSLKVSARSYYKIIWLIKRLNPKIIHVFSSWNFDLAFGIIKHKNLFSGRVVFDDYDVLAGMLSPSLSEYYYKKQIQIERYCLENADGLCCRSLEIQFAKRKMKYNITSKIMYFPEYMWDVPVKNKSVFSKNLVYIGSYNSTIAELAKKIAHIGWKLDVYPGHNSITLNSSLPSNLIIHEALSPKELLKTLQNYRLAIQLPGIIQDPKNSIYSRGKYNYAAAGKIFDYIECDLKVLIADELFQLWLLARYGSAIEVDSINTLEDIVRKLSNFELPISETGLSVNHLTLREQAPRLERFYKSIIAGT